VLTESTRDALRLLCDDWHRKAIAATQRLQAQNPKWKVPHPEAVDETVLERILQRMQAPVLQSDGAAPLWTPSTDWRWRIEPADVKKFLDHPEIDLVHVVRFLAAAGFIDASKRGLGRGAEVDTYLRHFRASHALQFGLREVGAAFRASGLDSNLIAWSRLDSYWPWQGEFKWEPAAVWPYFLEHQEMLEEVFELRPKSLLVEDLAWLRPRRRSNALAVLEAFPRIPPRLQPKLWEIALGGGKTDRLSAQRCLEREPETTSRVIASLGEGKQEARALAAEWLARLGDMSALPALETALRKEKHDAAKGALMNALEALGAPVDQFLDRSGLIAEAAKGLQRGIPAGIAWFPFDRMPVVHWMDTGEPIPANVVTWLIVQAHKLGLPEAGALLRRYARQMGSTEAQALGSFVLEAWIAQDIDLPTRQEVQGKAQQLAQQMLSYYPGKTLQEVTGMMVESLLNQPKGSAVGDKGVLAVAGACAGPAAVPLVGQYLKRWYGYRAAQCRALIQMLSWVDHPAAIQLVLSTATRFRTAGIRKEAEKQSQLIAERKGWTLGELADRTIPTAGFDENGELELDYGARRFVACLTDDLAIALTSEDGKPISGLPDPRAEESAELVSAAKAALSHARKELKTALKMQRERLYEAMCTERAWTFEDWDVYLHRHPIVSRYCRRLVWTARLGDSPAGTYRPVGDGSLTSSTDDAVTLPGNAVVRIAHASSTTEQEARAWSEHLAAYELQPLFAQFGRALFRMLPERVLETRVTDCLGHMLQAYKLRARATKLGYLRGQAEDGGWFYTYRKHFTTLGLEAVIEFTGNSLPEEDRPVALRSLYFARPREGANAYGPENECALGEVPAVLLSECWNDWRSIAAEGPGFDPDWEKKVEP
jgi:hypothetical protein